MIAFLATAVFALAGAQAPGRYCAASSGFGEATFFNEDSQRVTLRVEESHIKGSPAWTPGQSDVPLSPNAAYVAALAYITKTKPGIRGLKLDEILLKPVSCTGKNSAYYSVSWVVNPEPGVFKGYVKLAVLLDGKVLAPVATTP